jgi:WD40 repeat protein
MKDPIVIEAHGKHAQSVHFCRKHKYLVSAGMDTMVHLWSLPGFGRTASIKGHANSVNTLSFNPDETQLATGSSDQSVRIWSFPEGKLLHTLDKQVNASYNSDGTMLATIGTNGRVSLWNTVNFETPHQLPKMDKRIFTLSFSPNGKWLAIGGTGVIHCYNVLKDSLNGSLEGHKLAVPSTRFSPNGELLIATGAEGALSIWQVSTWTDIKRIELPGRGVLQTVLTASGERVYVSMDNLIAGFTLDDGNLFTELSLPIKGVYGLALSPDDALLANAGADGKLRIWEL